MARETPDLLRHPVIPLFGDENHRVGSCSNLFIAVWMNETRPAAVVRCAKEIRQLAATYSTVGLIQVLESGIKPLEQDARDAFSKLLRDGHGMIGCSTVVYTGSGFRAAAVRSIVSGLAFLTRTPYPHSVVATVEEAARRLHGHGVLLNEAEIIQATEKLRAEPLALNTAESGPLGEPAS